MAKQRIQAKETDKNAHQCIAMERKNENLKAMQGQDTNAKPKSKPKPSKTRKKKRKSKY